TIDTTDILIDVTGLDKNIVHSMLNILAYNFAEHGWIIEKVKIVTPNSIEYTPQEYGEKLNLDKNYVNMITGLNLNENEITYLLKKMRYNAEVKGNKIEVKIPPYRLDILHQIDLIEDVAIAYGFNKIIPELPNIFTIGHELHIYKVVRKVRDIMVGLGFQEVLNYIMTNKNILFEKMNKKIEKVVEVMNPKSIQYTVLRNSIIPGLLNFLSKNKHVEYPQKIFEIGEIVHIDNNEETRTKNYISLGFAITNFSLSLEEGLAVVYALFKNLGIHGFKLTPLKEEPSFIKGRVGKIVIDKINVGIIGEINPVVLKNFELENPTIVCEIDIEKIGKLFRSFYL
ncbi:MAG TPA: phenylalanine--tRNA ligase subunit beta, partial [Thermoprotei archaeon]|nr:phenylalanine--tRNA ligase subunit beta [Thermoprotei archaeon]